MSRQVAVPFCALYFISVKGLHEIKFTRVTHLTTKQKRVSWDSTLNFYVFLGN